MAAEDRLQTAPPLLPKQEERLALAAAWRRLARLATTVAVLTSPATFLVFYELNGWPLIWSLLATIVFVCAFRGLMDVIAHRLIPRASLYGAGRDLLDEDIVSRRRLWFWKTLYRRLAWFLLFLVAVEILFLILGISWGDVGSAIVSALPYLLLYGFQIPLLFFANLLIIFGPLLFFGLRQMKGYEPGDADWGVKLGDVRGQDEPKQEITRVISLWQSGEAFRAAGGKPERGVLFLGAPGVGKTMLAKAIATSFNSPIVTMPGSGFAQTFMGMDVIIVMFLISKARRLARKWGGQCIVFIDEIDAVGLRRQALGAGMGGGMMGPAALNPTSFQELAFYGPWGSLTPSGDVVIESREWRDRLFEHRAPGSPPLYPPAIAGLRDRFAGFMFPGGMMGGMGGGMALNQLLVQMDGVDEPPVLRKFFTNKLNTLLDAAYIVPQRIGRLRLRLKPPHPRTEQVYFIGATNVNPDVLDPALLRPGRMGRHIWFRTPTKDDRKDIFDLYLGRVAHDDDLDTDKRREELARITHGYSPAMIEQVCSMALTYAHADERPAFGWTDIVEAMTTIETGTAQNVEYMPEESRATAIHEAGHAVASHLYMDNILSTRLSIRKRGGSLGHYQGTERDERFTAWRHEEVGGLVMTLGAMAAEHVFYGENSTGVGGDVQSATMRSAYMVGLCGMGPEPVDLRGRVLDDAREEREREIMQRFERIGIQIMNRAGASPMSGDALAGVLSDPGKRSAAARILGQCYLTAVCAMRHNRESVAEIAEILVQRRELYGDEVVELLERSQLQPPRIDVLDENLAEAVSGPDDHPDVPEHPQDPAGSRPRHDPDELRPSGEGPLMSDPGAVEEIIEAEAFDEGLEERIDAHLAASLLPAPAGPGTELQVEVLDASSPPPHDARFQFVTGALLAIGVAAAFVVGGFLLGSHRDKGGNDGPAWSAWKPSKSGSGAAEQIAGHVGRQYRSPSGRQLVLVDGGPLEVAGLPLTVALRESADAGGNIKLFDGKSVLYRLCGLGKDCAISDGKPSIKRHLLLRREALELALYSFRYLKGVDQVVVFMPPKLGDQPSQALFFRKSQVEGELEKPLEATLVDRAPTVGRVYKSPDAGLVQQLTIPMLFRFTLTQANQDDRAFLVLDPFDSPAPQTQPSTSQSSSASRS